MTDIVERIWAKCLGENDKVSNLAKEAADEIEKLRRAEEGAKEAFGVLVEQKRDLEANCKRLQQLLDGAHDIIRRSSMGPNFVIGSSFAP